MLVTTYQPRNRTFSPGLKVWSWERRVRRVGTGCVVIFLLHFLNVVVKEKMKHLFWVGFSRNPCVALRSREDHAPHFYRNSNSSSTVLYYWKTSQKLGYMKSVIFSDHSY